MLEMIIDKKIKIKTKNLLVNNKIEKFTTLYHVFKDFIFYI